MILLWLNYFHIGGQAQVYYGVLSDTIKIYSYQSEGDTIYKPCTTKRTGEWIIQYSGTSQIAVHQIVTSSVHIDTNWYQNGQLKSISETTPSVCIECWNLNEWYRDGAIKSAQTCTKDSCIRFRYYHSGALMGQTKYFVDTLHRGILTWCYESEYYENGQLKFDPYNPNGPRQTIKNYYESGKVSREVTLQRTGLIGPYHEWYENGLVKVEGQYKMPPDDNGYHGTTQTGKWSYYNEKGKLIKEEFYEEGKLVKTVEY